MIQLSVNVFVDDHMINLKWFQSNDIKHFHSCRQYEPETCIGSLITFQLWTSRLHTNPTESRHHKTCTRISWKICLHLPNISTTQRHNLKFVLQWWWHRWIVNFWCVNMNWIRRDANVLLASWSCIQNKILKLMLKFNRMMQHVECNSI